MNHLAALWRHNGFRGFCSLLVGLGGTALAALAGAPAAAAAVFITGSLFYHAIKERVVLSPIWRRLFKTGRGAAGDWMSPIELRRHTRSLPRSLE